MKSNGEVHDHATMKIVGVGLELTLGTNQAKLGLKSQVLCYIWVYVEIMHTSCLMKR
uniref:Uncharacterized protein n=1 Tax=Manihot esculenta TaxID=3983 RepID=A0A199UC89_MANES